MQFTFSSDWDDLDKLCYLQRDEVSQPIEVVDGLVEVPEWFTEQDSFNITLLGTNGGQEVPTNVVYLHLEKSNTLWKQDVPEPQPSWLAKVIDLNNHPPIPGDNGHWLIWNTDSGTYVESELPLPDMPVGPSGGSVPKPLTFDYMSEGYPTKSVETTTLMDEQEVAFELMEEMGAYVAPVTNTFKIVDGQTYTFNWDGTEYECVGIVVNSQYLLGNLSIAGESSDTGEPFLYRYNARYHAGVFVTLDTAASHTISVKTTEETVGEDGSSGSSGFKLSTNGLSLGYTNNSKDGIHLYHENGSSTPGEIVIQHTNQSNQAKERISIASTGIVDDTGTLKATEVK